MPRRSAGKSRVKPPGEAPGTVHRMQACIHGISHYGLASLMDDKNKTQPIDLQALVPAPLKSRLTELRRYL